jgi:protocatechuate 3,4-dioxygenase beta subunit
VLVCVYHTNAEGIYPKRGDETGNGRRHGCRRGWLRADQDGRYRIRTIRPGTSPSRSEPGPIHLTVGPPGETERWVDSVHFADDPLLTDERRSGAGVVDPRPDREGVLHARLDLVIPPQRR